MKAVSATSASFHVNVGSDSEEEDDAPLKRRSRARPGNPGLGAKGEHLKTSSQSSLPPPRAALATPSAGGPGERMLELKDIRLTTQPTAWPMPKRPAPPIPTAGKPALQTEGIALKTPSPSLLERQRPAPISTARTPVAEPAGDEFHTPSNSPSQLASPTTPTSPTSVSSSLSLSVPTSPSSIPSPSWPSSPEATTPVVPQREGKQPMPLSPHASDGLSTSAAAPADTGTASPIEAVKLAGQFELFTDDALELEALHVPRMPPELFQDRAVVLYEFLCKHKHLLRSKDDVLFEQDSLQKLLASGKLRGIDPDRLKQLETLSQTDLRPKFQALGKLQADFDEVLQYVKDQGGDPNQLKRRARPMAEIQAERDRQLAEDNAAIAARQYPFH